MNITVINGSPKGEYSITLQTVKYLEAIFKEQTFTYLHPGSKIRSYEKDFSEAKQILEQSDFILFSYPVYTFLVPYQLHRFMELIDENHVTLTGKLASQITTSKHFYDITAHRFVEENCLDWGLTVLEGLSADMEDLLSKKGQQQAMLYFKHLLFSAQNQIAVRPLPPKTPFVLQSVTPGATQKKQSEKKVIVVADLTPRTPELTQMVNAFENAAPFSTRVINLREFRFQGGCLGCLKCAATGKCVYKDGFDSFLREHIQSADAIVYAFTVKGHSMGSLFKLYDDRQFCNGHRTVTAGKPVGYLVNGNISAEANLLTVINGRSQTGGNYLAGIATNETNPNEEINRLCVNLNWAMKEGYAPEANFLGVGGMKIFRDLIYAMRGLMKLDHRFYKEHGLYRDFPQKKAGTTALMYLAGAALNNPKLVSKMGNKMNEGMLLPYQKIIEQVQKGF